MINPVSNGNEGKDPDKNKNKQVDLLGLEDNNLNGPESQRQLSESKEPDSVIDDDLIEKKEQEQEEEKPKSLPDKDPGNEEELIEEIPHLKKKEKKDDEIDVMEEAAEEENEFTKEIIVGHNYEYKTIQSAVDAARPGTSIKIAKGIYRENIMIKAKTKIELCSLDPNDQAIILSENSPCIFVYCLEEQDTVKIFNLKFIHRGIRDDLASSGDILTSEFYSWHNQNNNKEAIFIFKNADEIEKLEVNYYLDSKIIENIFEDNRGNFTGISIMKGTTFITNCQISLAFLTTETKDVLPAVYIENSIGILENTLIKGNKDFLTVGVFSHNAQLKMNECKVFRHRCGGVVAVVDERNTVNINKCHLLGNSGCGVSIMSMAGKAALKEKSQGVKNALEINIEQNLFELNLGIGLILRKCFNASVIGNKFYKNLVNGAVFTDCDGFVMMNEFIKNKGCGLIVESVEEQNDVKIFKNIVSENYKNGIDVRGNNNNTLISQNSVISGNYLNGIFVHELASPQIKNNNIFENSYHGILIESNSFAEVLANKIYGNVRTNISFGGKLSENTKIRDNEIYKARNEGIYIIEANGGEITGNKVYENNEGIVLIKCENTLVSKNEIHNNSRTGVLFSDMSNPVFTDNEIYENYFIGVLIRDASKGIVEGNLMRQNVIQFYLSKTCLKQKKAILDKNNIEGRFDCADYCNIF